MRRLTFERCTNVICAWRASLQRLLEVLHVFRHALGRQQRFIRVDERLEKSGPWRGEQRIQPGSDVFVAVRANSLDAESFRYRREVDGLQRALVLRVAEEHELFPLDLAQCVVLHDHDLYREPVTNHGRKFA